MKKKVILALAGLAMAASTIGPSAMADESNALSISGADLSRLLTAPGSLPSGGGFALPAPAKSEAAEQRALRSGGENALLAEPLTAAPIIPAQSLVAGDLQLTLLSSPGGQPATGAFAPIKSALAGQSDSDLLSRSADPASLGFVYAPVK